MMSMIDSGSDIDVVSEDDWETIHELFERGEIELYNYKLKPDMSVRAFATETPLTMIASFSAWLATSTIIKPKLFVKFFVIRGLQKR